MAAPKQPACTSGPKHKWEWVKDVTLRKETMYTVRLSARGLYKCQCGATRQGASKGGL